MRSQLAGYAHLARMIEDMLRMSRLDAMVELVLKPVDLNALAQEILLELGYDWDDITKLKEEKVIL